MSDETKCDGKDTIHLGPVVDAKGTRACVRHTKDHQVLPGFVRQVKDGSPIHKGDQLINLNYREADGCFDVEEVYSAKAPAESAAGPAMVNSENFKSGWDRIFGNRTVGVA